MSSKGKRRGEVPPIGYIGIDGSVFYNDAKKTEIRKNPLVKRHGVIVQADKPEVWSKPGIPLLSKEVFALRCEEEVKDEKGKRPCGSPVKPSGNQLRCATGHFVARIVNGLVYTHSKSE